MRALSSGLSLLTFITPWFDSVRAATWQRSDRWGTRESTSWTDNPFKYRRPLKAIICHANRLPEYLEFAYDWDDPKLGPVGIPHGSQQKFSINWRADIDHVHGERLVAVEPWVCSRGPDKGRLCFVSFTIARITNTAARWEDPRTYECGNPMGAMTRRGIDESSLSISEPIEKRAPEETQISTVKPGKSDPIPDEDEKRFKISNPFRHWHFKKKKKKPAPPATGTPVHGPVMGHPVNTAWGYPVYHRPVAAFPSNGRLPPNTPRYGSLSTDPSCRCGYGMILAQTGFIIGLGGGYILLMDMYEREPRRKFNGMEPAPVWHQYHAAIPTPYVFFEGESVDIDYHGKVKLGTPRIDQLAVWYLHL
ncbi:protein of unknown function [Taphrina deformans PYCC 5710]|uniref:Uncharacterized protein n=1 Tax=Taphrina deformans (strain PYCC 5710 / ATCC 11124 / CBS 356.35 / IMI 108563 / JCM 9778 / NBRC 8474) TaxID=1097556 RepID=R4XPL5_TAPDE|nr:protein of unknown function [Taphrina deformans PYCC 5710]|eukprot:CCG85151.1 protein of unknown function [Taphrina deformans PYCC 5710]